jgi:hypothetical protein
MDVDDAHLLRLVPSRLLLRAKRAEFVLWIGGAILALIPALAPLLDFGLGELLKSRFYEAVGTHLATGFFLLFFPTLIAFIFGTPPLTLVLASVTARLRSGSLQEATVVGGLLDEPNPERDPIHDYLVHLTRQSKNVADSHLRRSNVHLLSGVLIGMAGLAFFFVTTSDARVEAIASAPDAGVWATLLLNLALSVPRLAILIFIELMAGFFLKQYRTALEEYRYFETIQRRREALLATYMVMAAQDDPDGINTQLLYARIFDSDQPGVLKTGETTTILEAQRNSANELSLNEVLIAALQLKGKR